MLLYILDLVGVFAFAFFGAHNAKNHAFNWVGMTLCALLTALGGGIIRSIILNQTPACFSSYAYVTAVILGVSTALFLHNRYTTIRPSLLCMDAAGIITFAYLGAAAAVAAHYGPLASMACAALTAYGGGVLSDLLILKKPQLLDRRVTSLSPVIVTGLLCWLTASGYIGQSTAGTCIAVAFFIQLQISYGYFQILRRYAALVIPRHIRILLIQSKHQTLLELTAHAPES